MNITFEHESMHGNSQKNSRFERTISYRKIQQIQNDCKEREREEEEGKTVRQ